MEIEVVVPVTRPWRVGKVFCEGIGDHVGFIDMNGLDLVESHAVLQTAQPGKGAVTSRFREKLRFGPCGRVTRIPRLTAHHAPISSVTTRFLSLFVEFPPGPPPSASMKKILC